MILAALKDALAATSEPPEFVGEPETPQTPQAPQAPQTPEDPGQKLRRLAQQYGGAKPAATRPDTGDIGLDVDSGGDPGSALKKLAAQYGKPSSQPFTAEEPPEMPTPRVAPAAEPPGPFARATEQFFADRSTPAVAPPSVRADATNVDAIAGPRPTPGRTEMIGPKRRAGESDADYTTRFETESHPVPPKLAGLNLSPLAPGEMTPDVPQDPFAPGPKRAGAPDESRGMSVAKAAGINDEVDPKTGKPSLAARVANALGEAAAHPIKTVAGIAMAPIEAAITLNRAAAELDARNAIAAAGGDPSSVEQTVTPQQAAVAATQLISLPLGPELGRVIGGLAAPFIGSRAAAAVASTTVGAGVGAVYSPDDPAVGAVLGAGTGAVHAFASGARAPALRPRGAREAPIDLSGRPERLLAGPEPVQRNATARVVPEEPRGGAPAAAESPYTVEMNTPGEALAQLATKYRGKEPSTAAPAAEPTATGAPAPAEAATPSTPSGPMQAIKDILTTARQKTADVIAPELAQERRALDRQANTDALTGLGNQRAYEGAVKRAEADPNTAVIRFDLNGFKSVNDIVGHDAGDKTLQRVATAIRDQAKGLPSFRVGGDEFAVIVPAADAARIRDAIENAVGVNDLPGAKGSARLSISGGVGETNATADAAAIARKAEQKKAQGIAGRDEVQGTNQVQPSSSVRSESIENIDVEPERFQYKLNTNEKGVGRELESVKQWNPDLAGVIGVWRDPVDGRLKVINGHHRVDLAQRNNVKQVDVREIQAPDAVTARATGAIINVAEGRGTAVDAAKLFRDTQMSPADLEKRGVSLTGQVAKDGLALAKLHPTIFDDVVAGRMPVQRAAVIGNAGLQPEQQLALTGMLEQREAKGKRMSNDAVAELIRFVKDAGSENATQESLFGVEQMTQSLAPEKAELSAYVKDKLGKDRRLFGFLTKGGRAEHIEGAGVGKIETGRASVLATEAAQAEEVYNKLSTMSGPVSDALTTAAREWVKGGDKNAIRAQLYEAVSGAVRTAVGGAEGSRGEGSTPAPQRDGAPREPGEAQQAAAGAEEVAPPFVDPDQSGFSLGENRAQYFAKRARAAIEDRLSIDDPASVKEAEKRVQQYFDGAFQAWRRLNGSGPNPMPGEDVLRAFHVAAQQAAGAMNRLTQHSRARGYSNMWNTRPITAEQIEALAMDDADWLAGQVLKGVKGVGAKALDKAESHLADIAIHVNEYATNPSRHAKESEHSPHYLDALTTVERARREVERELLGVDEAGRTLPADDDVLDTEVNRSRGALGPPAPRRAKEPTRAYHGSPYRFDKFRTDAIGSGEGAASFGWGHYFTSKKEIAEHYRSKLADNTMPPIEVLREYFKPGRIVPAYAGRDRVLSFDEKDGDWSVTVRRVVKKGDEWVNDPSEPYPRSHHTSPHWKEVREVLGADTPRPGGTYEVDIPDETTFLDWDKPLSEQSPAVRAVLEEHFVVGSPKRTGQEFYDDLALENGSERDFGSGDLKWSGNVPDYEATSKLLRSHGINGIRYLDGGSRAKGEGTHNYVVFDEESVSIRRVEERRRGFVGGALEQLDRWSDAGVWDSLGEQKRREMVRAAGMHELSADAAVRSTWAELQPGIKELVAPRVRAIVEDLNERNGGRFGLGRSLLGEPRHGYDPKQLEAFLELQKNPVGPKAEALRADEAKKAFGSVAKKQALVDAIKKIQGAGLPTSTTRLGEMRAAAQTRKTWVDLRGARIATLERMHRALQVFRHPGVERMHVILLNEEDQIVSHTAETVGAISFVDIQNVDKWVDNIVRRAERLGVRRAIISHNHPSGDPTPSDDDKAFTSGIGGLLQARGIRLVGHLVMDHEEGNWLSPGPAGKIVAQAFAVPGDPAPDWKTAYGRGQQPLSEVTIGQIVRDSASPSALTVFYLDSQNRIVAVEPRPVASATSVARWLGPQQRAHGARSTVLAAAPAIARELAATTKTAVRSSPSLPPPFDPEAPLAEHRWAHDVLDIIEVVDNGQSAPTVKSYAESGHFWSEPRNPTGYKGLKRLREPRPERAYSEGSRRADADTEDPGRIPKVGRVGERDLFGNETPIGNDKSDLQQGSLFSSKEGTSAARNLRETERAARAELEKLRLQEAKTTSPLERVKLARRMAELERLVNRDKAIGADELRTRAAGEGDFFGGVKETTPSYSGPSKHPMPEPTGMGHRRSNYRLFDFGRKLKAVLNPESLGLEASRTAGNIRHEAAERFRAYAQAVESLKELREHIDKQKRERQVELWDAYEKGQPTGDAFVDAANRIFRDVTEQRTNELIALDRLKAERAIENYIGRFWSTENTDSQTKNFLASIFAKRPFEGRKSFLKQRSLESFVDGLDAGLIPPTYNYVESQLAKIAEMERLIGAEHMLRAEQEAGRAKPVMIGKEPPKDVDGESWVKIDREGNDPAFTIWAPPEVTHWEAVDSIVFGKLQKLIKDLNIHHERKTKTGGALGYARKTPETMVTKFGGTEGTVMHELGHILDWRYGLNDRINEAIGRAPRRTAKKGKRAGREVPDYAKEGPEARARRKELREELRNLANMRRETLAGVPKTEDLSKSDRAYLHSGPEKMANLVEAYVHVRDRFKKVAPGIFEIFDSVIGQHEELHPLRDIQPSLAREPHTATTRLPGPVLAGYWYAPRNSAAVWQNHLSRGLRGNPIYDALTAPGMAATQIILGISGFHGTVIATEGMFSDMVMAMDHIASGQPVGAVKALGRVVGSPLTSAISSISPKRFPKLRGVAFGDKVMQEYLRPGTHPELARIIQAMIAGGFRGKAKSELWSGEQKDKLKRALRDALHGNTKLRKAWGASRIPLDALYAGVEAAAGPLMSRYVPLMKTASTYHAVAKRLAELPPDISIDRLHDEMWEVVNEMDDRFGQVDYDNHFVNRIVKDMAQALFLAPGWTFGTLTLAARGLGDVARSPKRVVERMRGDPGAKERPLLGRSGKYWVAAVVGTMIINGILTFFATGEQPGAGDEDGWKDFFAFRDGTYDVNGNANRHTIPGYLMHDIYGWSHHPFKTFRNKLSPFFSFATRVAKNETFFGDLLRDPDASVGKQIKQVGVEAAKELGTPLSVQNYFEGRKRGDDGSSELARNLFGVTPAKREFVRSDAQNRMTEYLSRRSRTALTPDQLESQEARSKVLFGLRSPKTDDLSERITHAVERGDLTPPELTRMMKRAGILPLQEQFKSLTLDQALDVFNRATPREKGLLMDILNAKVATVGRD